MTREQSSVVQAVARKHPALDERTVAQILIDGANEIHGELLSRSLNWRDSNDPGASYREAEARACASIAFSLGEVN